ncbi:4-hydroxy-tetrahydrodipicolinate reductase [Slackia heliotrinireducens]|uniref:4-hydroxy-tetrahydrodipicolinate reductase n=1 Tax=Slackia heliotrinireducens TaxID=84110 RepID=UPI0033155205
MLMVGNGRMGTVIAGLIEAEENMQVVSMIGIENKDDSAVWEPEADVVIDFSHKDMLPLVDEYVRRTGAALLSGTTGYDEADMDALRALGEVAPTIHSANYSLGVAVLKHLAADAAKALEGFDIEITETHHNQKADAPSGTAKLLLKCVDPEGEYDVVSGRDGMVGKRPKREIGMHALRGGTVAGTHTVHFFGNNEEVELTHRAQSRTVFAAGAVAGAKKLVNAEKKFYTFDELMFA